MCACEIQIPFSSEIWGMPSDLKIAFRLRWPGCPHLSVMPFKQFAPLLLPADPPSSLLSPVAPCLVANKNV